MNRKAFRMVEFLGLYVVAPLLLIPLQDMLKNLSGGRSFVVLFLPIIAGFLLFLLFYKKAINWRELLQIADFKRHLFQILKLFLPFSLFISVITYWFFPDLFLVFPLEMPLLWLLILFFYPLLSVLPQGIIYRVFFYKRYYLLFENQKVMWVVSALSFCLCHLFFQNIYAIVFTLLGGFLFSYRYQQTGSWLITSLEHALYGNLLFTIGLGRFLVS
ncbi:MAG: CPBP family glutamic-type intramembrane protease [Capnocytophaga sp.]|nr:CPBP family glutamic-type intramembrane protease [Capnocytophaga sp.]